jgi:hypothetical protein
MNTVTRSSTVRSFPNALFLAECQRRFNSENRNGSREVVPHDNEAEIFQNWMDRSCEMTQ